MTASNEKIPKNWKNAKIPDSAEMQKNLKTEKISKNAKNLMTAKQAKVQRIWKSRD